MERFRADTKTKRSKHNIFAPHLYQRPVLLSLTSKDRGSYLAEDGQLLELGEESGVRLDIRRLSHESGRGLRPDQRSAVVVQIKPMQREDTGRRCPRDDTYPHPV